MERKLATIQTIKAVDPIPGADSIEVVSFEKIGWKCVIGKGSFQPGNKCVYFEIDSFLPEKEEYEFLRPSSFRIMHNGEQGFKLRTVCLRGQVSQGLAMPIPQDVIAADGKDLKEREDGFDVTELLNIKKWDIAPESADIKGDYPGYLTKSDQERIQNLIDFFELYQDVEFEESIKLDGSAHAIFHRDGDIGILSRNNELKMNQTVPFYNVVKNNFEALKTYNKNISIQGEFMGPGIQKNREELTEKEFFVYNIFDADKCRFLTPRERKSVLKDLASLGANFKQVPILGWVKIFQECKTLEDLLKRADGKSLKALIREGLVFKSVDLVNGEIIQFKVISNKFLLKGGE